MRLVFAVTSHGLGHLTRTCELANALRTRVPDLEIHFWSEIPPARVAVDLEGPFTHRTSAYEPGTAQRNCFELDVDATVRDYAAYLDARDARLEEEVAALAGLGCDGVVCDVPALAIRAAAAVGVPAIAVSNFTWDWILEPILAGTPAAPALDLLRADYRLASRWIRLPFGPRRCVIASSENGELVSRRARLDAAEVRRRIGLSHPGRKPLALVCPGGWDADDWSRITPDTGEFDLVLVGDLPVDAKPGDVSLPHALPAPLRFPDLVAAADVVLAKPGYGIASECVVHRTPLVTIDRPGFRETAMLREELSQLGPCAELSLEDFFAGRWAAGLGRALHAGTPWAGLAPRPDLELADRVLSALIGAEGAGAR